ncbi:energy transducer TonB [Flavobacterium sp. GSA192]|uniref:energy transducer TonB n=1 Tax=Flavobacterium sp. GSA192 TaxID=2576304 RepID=UPI001126BAAF|nr:energy transducer TonB [Flavobacterium sp. GSA192]
MKTYLLTTSLLFATMALYSQIIKPTRYNLDSLGNLTNKEDYKYIRVVENYKEQPNLFIFSEYYKSGAIKMKAISTKLDKPYFEGPQIEYYENGNKKKESNYLNNKLSGLQMEWYENNQKTVEKIVQWDSKARAYNEEIKNFWDKNGQQTVNDGNGIYEYTTTELYEKGQITNGEKQGVWEGKNFKENYSYSEIYNNGKFISGISSDENNNKFPYKELTGKADAKNGMQEFYRFIAKNYRTPNIQGLQGKIYVTFIIDKEGKLTKFKILRDLGHGTGQEAIRVLQKAENWIPGKMRGMPCETQYSLPISIKTSGSSNYPNQEPTFESQMTRNTNPRW